MTDDTNSRLKRIEEAKASLAAAYAADPTGVDRFNGRMGKLAAARKRERDRFDRMVLGQGDPRPVLPTVRRPAGMSKQLWKAENDRVQRAYRAELDAWSDRERRRGRNAPPAEQMAKAPFIETDVNDHVSGKAVKIGRAYCRQPRFETFDWLSVAALLALRRYRRAHDVSELSPVKSGLDIGAGGGSGGSEAAISRVEALAFADIAVKRIEAGVPAAVLRTLRAVALEDADFKAVAIERYGSASGHRRTRVRQDFERGVAALVAVLAPPPPAPMVAANVATSPPPPVNPAFLDDRGHLRPMGEIVDIILGRGDGEMGEAA